MLDVGSEVCLARILIDRMMCRYGLGETEIDESFQSVIDSAKYVIAKENKGDVSESSLELGSVYEGYLREMRSVFGFRSMRDMLRAILVMTENGDL